MMLSSSVLTFSSQQSCAFMVCFKQLRLSSESQRGQLAASCAQCKSLSNTMQGPLVADCFKKTVGLMPYIKPALLVQWFGCKLVMQNLWI